MMATRAALAAAASSASSASAPVASPLRSPKRSLALSVHFLHPDLGMRTHEILSRATAFLLAVDPPDPHSSSPSDADTVEALLERREEERRRDRLSRHYLAEPAGGPPRDASELGWLEFCPRRHRPAAHVVAASHVLCPWLWRRYYPQEWLRGVRLEHCAYSVEVYGGNGAGGGGGEEKEEEGGGGMEQRGGEALAKFALNPYPIHHPSGMDLAIMHLKNEEAALKHMQDLGVELLHLRDDEIPFECGEEVLFDGFEVAEDNAAGASEKPQSGSGGGGGGDDERVFSRFEESGNLVFASTQRVLASTSRPLPEGLCGGPVLDSRGSVAGVVEGIVPPDHDDERLRGAAGFIPSPAVGEFVQWAERGMLERIVPAGMFEKVVRIKAGDSPNDEEEYDLGDGSGGGAGGGRVERLSDEGEVSDDPNFFARSGAKLGVAYDQMVESMKKYHTPEEIEAVLATIERERREVIDTMNKEGGDMDEVIAKVRRRTMERRNELIEQIRREQGMEEGEAVNSEGPTHGDMDEPAGQDAGKDVGKG